ncbi:MAG: YdbC family protein [Oscillospiraceae bacterium]|nr:YdbC family protein [Oscillospiraceae bacterium]
MAEFSYEIQEQIGVLSQNTNGWSRQLNKISWNGRDPKFDIRDWAPNNEKMGKGISLSMEELQILKDILNSMDI